MKMPIQRVYEAMQFMHLRLLHYGIHHCKDQTEFAHKFKLAIRDTKRRFPAVTNNLDCTYKENP